MNTIIQTRIDNTSKTEAETILKKMGMSLSDGIRIFIRQVINTRSLPFQPVVMDEPNEELKEAMKDAVTGHNLSRSFSGAKEAMNFLNEEAGNASD